MAEPEDPRTGSGRLVEERQDATRVAGRADGERDAGLGRQLDELAHCGPGAKLRRRRILDELKCADRQASPRTATRWRTSSHEASRDATGRSSDVWWCWVREVVNPIAPAMSAARSFCRHRREVVVGRLLPRTPAPPWRKCAARCGRCWRRVVDPLGQPVDGVEVFGERGPRPVDARVHGGPGHVLGSLQAADHQQPVVAGGGGQGEPAIAHHDGRHAVPAGIGAQRIPEHLGVQVRVAIDESRGDRVAVGVDVDRAVLTDAADGGDAAVD